MRRKYIGRNYRINIFGGEKFLPWSEPAQSRGLRRTPHSGNKSEFPCSARKAFCSRNALDLEWGKSIRIYKIIFLKIKAKTI